MAGGGAGQYFGRRTSSSDSTLANSHDFWLEGGLANPEIRMKKVENL